MTKTQKSTSEENGVSENEVLSYNMGGYIYKVAYKQIEKLDEYADAKKLDNWFTVSKSLWRKVKAGLSKANKKELVAKTDKTIFEIEKAIGQYQGKPKSRNEQEGRQKAKRDLLKNLEALEQSIFDGMIEIKMWIPSTKEYNSPEDEFKATF